MELLNLVIGGLTSVAGGGLLGLAGTLFKGVIGIFAEAEKRRQRKQEMDHEIAVMTLQGSLAKDQAEADWRREVSKQEGEARTASYSYAQISGPVWVWVASVVTLMRPVLTLYLVALVSVIGYKLFFGTPLPYVNVSVMTVEILDTIIFLSTTALTWWFGDRPPQKR